MDNEVDVSADVDVDVLMARIRNAAKGGKTSGSRRFKGTLQADNLGSILESIEVGSIIQELHRGGALTDVINQIPLKAVGRKGKLEFKVKKFIKWLVHWNTKAQADFNLSVMRSLGLVAEQLNDVQRNFAKIAGELKEDSEQRAEIRKRVTEQQNRLSAMFEDLSQEITTVGAQIEGFELRVNDRFEHLWKETNRKMNEQESRLSATIEGVDRKADAAGASSTELEQKFGSELEHMGQEANQHIDEQVREISTRLVEIEQLKGQVEQTAQATHHIDEQMHQISTRLVEIEQLKGQVEQTAQATHHIDEQMHQISTRLVEIEQLKGQVEQTAQATQHIDEQVHQISTRLVEIEQLKGQVEQTTQATQSINEQMHQNAGKLVEIEELKVQVAQTAQATQHNNEQMLQISTRLGEIDRKADAVAVQCSGLEEKGTHDIDEMRMRILRAERSVRATKSANNSLPLTPEPAEEISQTKPPTLNQKTNGKGSAEVNTLLTPDRLSDQPFDYFLFEHRFRGTVSEIKRRQSMYVELFLGKQNVVDLGCGRGEFVELLSGNGVNVTGIDNNEDMVEFCRDKGLRVVLSDIFDYLNDAPNATLEGIAALQVIEHLSFEQILKLINLCGQKLKSGGAIVVETVNTNCSAALANFYLDPSHIRPVPAEMLRFVFEQGPFEVRSFRFSSPIYGSNLNEVLKITSGLPQAVSSYQDYAVVAYRR